MHSPWLIGIDLGGTKIEVILLDQGRREHFRHRVPTPQGDYPAILATIQQLVRSAEQLAGYPGVPVGVGIPGSVSGVTGKVKNSNSLCLNGQNLPADLSSSLGRKVTVTNDADCLALSEAMDGAGRGEGVVFAAILGTGCGSGISVDGRLLSGPNGVAGEWGHNPLPWTPQHELDQRPCFCGQTGCNETFLSGTGLARTHQLLWNQVLTAPEIARAARAGDRQAGDTMETYLEHLARGLAGVINLLDPDVIVLGGGVSNLPELYHRLPERLPCYVFGGECSTPIRQAVHGDSSGVRGAAWLAAGSETGNGGSSCP
ncbi:N-acetylglucosamine kinase [Marinobacter persicus]|uniref:N-acetylglucosamine kinase n=1 Tax=Marinobacter persicus TaxID=930118 RepID=A0A1I3TVD3_9GAMM|nr:ROK family protein [Marinobacter persicus]GHD45908.1 fructokinase [Marinobacter persicus]SFJ73531.1 N-acetylglucosamine kinase [Marinobacter persicus]